MDIITLTSENIEKEHICCAIASNKDCQVSSKKAWLTEQFKEGLVFKKGDVRGKVFIEYIPAEKAWCPIDAAGYMFINCLWVSGRYNAKYVPIVKEIAESQGIQFKVIQYKTVAEAQSAHVASTTYSLFYNGEFITNDILSEKKFIKLLEKIL